MHKSEGIYVICRTGTWWAALLCALRRRGYDKLILRPHAQLDLTRQTEVEKFFVSDRSQVVIDAAAVDGSIRGKWGAGRFFHINSAIQENLTWTAFKSGVEKFLFLGSACMYPRDCPQPMLEVFLLTGLPEYTNEGYALVKCCGTVLCF